MIYKSYYIDGVLYHSWEKKDHKYIDKIKTKTGKWRYIYDYNLTKGLSNIKNYANLFSNKLLNNNNVDIKEIEQAYTNYDANDAGDVYRKNKRYAETSNDIVNNSTYDVQTGMAVKNKEYTMEEDIKNVNPRGYDAQTGEDSTTSYAEVNCVLCSVTYCLRRKGYNVTAGLTDGIENNEINNYLSSMFEDKDGRGVTQTIKVYDPKRNDLRIASEDKIDYYDEDNGMPRSVWESAAYGENTFYVNCAKRDLYQYPAGSYGIFMYSSPYGGHAMNWEIDKNGNLIFIDGQTNQIVNDEWMHSQLDYSGYYSYCRLDDKNIKKEKNKGFDFIKKYIISDIPNKILEALKNVKTIYKKLINDEKRLEPKMSRKPKSYKKWKKEQQDKQLKDYKMPENKNIIKQFADKFDDIIDTLKDKISNIF